MRSARFLVSLASIIWSVRISRAGQAQVSECVCSSCVSGSVSGTPMHILLLSMVAALVQFPALHPESWWDWVGLVNEDEGVVCMLSMCSYVCNVNPLEGEEDLKY